MSSPEEPHRPVPPQPGHEPAAGPPTPGQPPVPYYAATAGTPDDGAPAAGSAPYAPPNGDPSGPPATGAPPYGPPASGASPGYGPPAGPPANSAPPYGAGAPTYGPPSYGPPSYGPPSYGPPSYGPPSYGPPYYGGPGQPPKKSRKALWIVLGIVGGVLLLVAAGTAILASLVGGATDHARGLSDEFTNLIIAGDVNSAYENYLDPTLMQNLSREEFAAGVESLGLDGSCKPAYSTVKVNSSNGSNAADIAGFIECSTKRVELVYRFEGRDESKMVNIRLRPEP